MKNEKFLFNPIQAITFALFFSISIGSYAQKESGNFEARNTIFVGLGGNSGRYAINFSRIVYQKQKFKLNVGAGFSMWSDKMDFEPINNTKWFPVMPLEVSGFWGKSKHHLEIGTGITSFLSRSLDFDQESLETIEKVVFDAFIPFRIGYRYQKPQGGFFFRVGYTPFFSPPSGQIKKWGFEPRYAGLSIGKSF